jgi:hypothetical protein
VTDHHIARPGVASPEGEVSTGRFGHPVPSDISLKLVSGLFPTAILEMLARVPLQQELEDAPPIIDRCH